MPQTILSLDQRFVRSLVLTALASLTAPLLSQAINLSRKPVPAKIEKQILIFPDSVVAEQWPHTLKLVNPPENLKVLDPGECIRVGIVATGDDRDSLLEKTQLSFRVEFAGQAQDHALAPLAGIKQIKPEGGDFVTQALGAGGIQNPFLTTASLAASAEKWCIPEDANDGLASFDVEVETLGGSQKLAQAEIKVESFETGNKPSFKNGDELQKFLMGYHRQPNSARLFAALQFFAADERLRSQKGAVETTATIFGAALKENPGAAKDLMLRLTSQAGFTRAFGMLVLLQGGYDIGPVLKTMSDEERQRFANHPVLPDAYDFTHVEDIGTRLDMLWSLFMTTGQFAPIQKIASALSWRSDWEDFDKARKSSTPIKEWTPSIGRAVGYGAAGWALGSFQRTDPLAADYIEFLIASPDAPDAIKAELKGLETNPAFKWQDKK